jgi:hypothetical protein
VESLGVGPRSVTPRLAPAIARRCINLDSLLNVLLRVVRQGNSYLTFQVRDTYTEICSILRLSAFKAHLRKHGLDPERCVDTVKRDQSSTKVRRSIGPVRVKEERVSNPHGSPHDQISLPVLPDCWDQLFSLPGNPCKLAMLSVFADSLPPVMTCAATPQMMQPEQLSGAAFSTRSPLLLAPSPRIVPDCNAGYYLTPSRASSTISSPYPSSMAPSPVLAPGMGIDFMSDVNLQLRPYLTRQDWTSNVWQDRGIQFVG